MFWLPFEIFWAAAKHFILPYGIGGGIIAACIVLYFFTDILGVTVANWLRPLRNDLIWIAVVTAGIMVFMSYIVHLGNKACEDRQVVITNTVHKKVDKATSPSKTHDPYDDPQN
jgi:hypothetical protein